ncbi:MAG: acylphosphatase [Bacteroidetes bacterium]|nr:acylphosphatase [Bacteroidota bacterium]
MIIAKTFKIFGKVQNVGFRFYTHKKAKEYNIMGFVRNEPDGSVYIEAEGESIFLEVFETWCKLGPPWARVSDFKSNQSLVMNYSDFKIK